ncbi:MAG: TonB-dependent receptor [Bacteroidota bacterium]
MKKYYLLSIIILSSLTLLAQNKPADLPGKGDTLSVKNLNEVVISALRTKVPMLEIPASISVVSGDQLNTMNKTIQADEAFRNVPGVRIDNGTGGQRVHFYIRGTGVLTESGFRGIGVLVDGIPVNDPSGFVPDLYDVDWATVKSVEVVKGLAASTYGCGATGGVVNILTMDGGKKPVNSMFYASAGSYGFWKVLGQVDGTQGNINYRVTYSHNQGHGYREHQAFMSDIFNEKMNWTPSSKVKITQILSYTSYFNQNSEGINLARYEVYGPRAANTDAVPYNEFHKTQRLTGALLGTFLINDQQNLQVNGFMRLNNYRETSNNGDDYKPFVNYGASGQYNLTLGKKSLVNHLGIGIDYASKTMTEHMFAVDHDLNRVDSYFGESCIDLNTLLINQIIRQRSFGFFLIDKLDIGKRLFATLNLRYDDVNNLLDSAGLYSGNRSYNSPSFRFGLAYNVADYLNLYANVGTGFLVPTEDELYNNPVQYGGFNELIKPQTSVGFELGARGDVNKRCYYSIAGFLINSDSEFYRYSIPERGNNTAFYGNKGGSQKYGIETFISWSPLNFLHLNAAYTWSHFLYTSPESSNGHWIPQCPQHVLSAEVAFVFLKHFTLTLGTQYQSKWYIQTDDSIYLQYTENGIKRNSWVDGFNTYSANLAYKFHFGGLAGDVSLFAKNLFDEKYFGFTEPNNGPDYNSYQPAPGREFFVNLRLRF